MDYENIHAFFRDGPAKGIITAMLAAVGCSLTHGYKKEGALRRVWTLENRLVVLVGVLETNKKQEPTKVGIRIDSPSRQKLITLVIYPDLENLRIFHERKKKGTLYVPEDPTFMRALHAFWKMSHASAKYISDEKIGVDLKDFFAKSGKT